MAEQLANFFVELFKNKIPEELTIFIISLFPILEIRGGMIAARILEVDFLKAFAICYVGNMLPIPFILLFIRRIFKFLRRFKFMNKIVDRLEAKGEKNREKVLRCKAWGLLAFVAIPIPGTGGWTGALIAALLDLRMKKALPIIAIGVLIAGLIMSLLTYGIF
jgi:uncharacterized membrane protein